LEEPVQTAVAPRALVVLCLVARLGRAATLELVVVARLAVRWAAAAHPGAPLVEVA